VNVRAEVRTYRRTPWRKVINAVETVLIRLGLAPRHRYLLTVVGRKTGTRYTTPVSVVEDASDRYLVAPYGVVEWVRNAGAAGWVLLSRGGRQERYTVREVSPAEAAPILRKYIKLEPLTRPFLPVSPDSSDAEVVEAAGSRPVLKLTPAA
jgi:deazaflavin-dependent oxidoreductase (nitroreductase family)